MPITKNNQTDFIIDEKSNCVCLTKSYIANNKFRFKKITGSRLAAVLGKDKYSSPFKTWTIMTGIYYEEMDKTIADAGNIIEPKIRQLAIEKLNTNFKSYNPIDVKWDLFKENKIFGGIPDGEAIDSNGNFYYDNGGSILEIKTTSKDKISYKKDSSGVFKMQKDKDGMPIVVANGQNKKYNEWFDTNMNPTRPGAYSFQLGLYLYLRNAVNGYFVVCFLLPEDYLNLDNTDITNRKVEFIKFDFSRSDFEPYIHEATDWYNKHIPTGISPKMTDEDKKWFLQQLKEKEKNN